MIGVQKRVNAEELGSSAEFWLDTYLFCEAPRRNLFMDPTLTSFAVQIVPGHVLLPLLALTFLYSKTAVRHATLTNVVLIFMFTDIVSCFL
jgi:hypothetical protein